MKNNKKGFTLIELLVVIAIIGLLSTLAVVSLNNARSKSRDARRVADVKQMQTALELFYNDASRYPDGQAVTAGEEMTAGTDLTYSGATYMASVPDDPSVTGAYTYTQRTVTTTGDSYTLEYTLEGLTGGIPSGTRTASPAGICDDPGC